MQYRAKTFCCSASLVEPDGCIVDDVSSLQLVCKDNLFYFNNIMPQEYLATTIFSWEFSSVKSWPLSSLCCPVYCGLKGVGLGWRARREFVVALITLTLCTRAGLSSATPDLFTHCSVAKYSLGFLAEIYTQLFLSSCYCPPLQNFSPGSSWTSMF